MTRRALGAALGLIVFASTSALSADLSTDPIAPSFTGQALSGWEVRGGVFAHDPWSPESGSYDLNGEILAPQIVKGSNSFWGQFIPHPDLGFTANFIGKTSNIYGGAAWNFDVTRRIFLSADFGLGVNNGEAGMDVTSGHNAIGCHWWFHESATAGYRLTEAWSVMTTIEHSSNAGACVNNRGLTNVGLRLGYRF